MEYVINILKFIRTRLSFILRIFLVIGIPILGTYWIFQPKQEPFESPTDFGALIFDSPEFISSSTIGDLREMLIVIANAPNLGFRRICIKNQPFVSINNNLIGQELSKNLEGVGTVYLDVVIGNSTSTFIVEPEHEKCITIKKNEETQIFKLGPKRFLLSPSGAVLERNIEPNNNPEKPGYKIEIGSVDNNVRFFYQISWHDVIIKFLLIFVFWNSLLVLVIKLYKFLRFGYKMI